MQKNSAESFIASFTMLLLAWCSIGPIVGSLLSFVHGLPTRWPALVHFADSPLQWRLLFFLSGCFALATAWFVHKEKFVLALGTVVVFAALYIPVFPIVWGQRTVARILAGVAVIAVAYLFAIARRQKV